MTEQAPPKPDGRPPGLVQYKKTEEDALTQRLQAALHLLETDSRYRLTATKLAELADCTRGTLRNRKWPLQRLAEIKAFRKAATTKRRHHSNPMAEMDVLRQKLELNRLELLRWQEKHALLLEQLQTEKDRNEVLVNRLDAAEAENKEVTAKLLEFQRLARQHTKVIPIKP